MDIDTGDVVWVDFDPAFGHEQSGRRPALVLSNRRYNARSSCVIVCPITTSQRSWPFRVPLPAGRAVRGFVVVDQIKAIDKLRIVSMADVRLDAPVLARIEELVTLITFGPKRSN